MAKKAKGSGRTVYFKDAKLWDKLQKVADRKKWSVNQVIQDMVEVQLFTNSSSLK